MLNLNNSLVETFNSHDIIKRIKKASFERNEGISEDFSQISKIISPTSGYYNEVYSQSERETT